jgi:hypothetical protein
MMSRRYPQDSAESGSDNRETDNTPRKFDDSFERRMHRSIRMATPHDGRRKTVIGRIGAGSIDPELAD